MQRLAGPARGEQLAERFLLEDVLGETRWGSAYRALDRETGRACRVEVILRSGSAGAALDRALAREVRIGNELAAQSGFVTAYAWGRLGPERVFIAREGTEPLPYELDAADLAARLGSVLAVARRVELLHALGVAHRDLGPHTLVSRGGALALRGFGLASLRGVRPPVVDPSGCPLGFLPAAAPEALRDVVTAGAEADVYALGAMLHKALAGEWPQPAALKPLATWLATEAPAAPTSGPADLEAIRAAALDLDPAARPSAQSLAEALEAHLGAGPQRPDPAEPPPGLDLSGRVRPRKRPAPVRRPGPGVVLGARFRLAIRLEETRWGELYQAKDQVRQRPCRVEIVLASGERGPDRDRLAEREVRACLGISAPGLLPALAWGRLGPARLFVARDAVPGLRPIDLDASDRTPPGLRRRVRRLALAARCVGALGKQGLVHRDLGPHTLFQDRDGGIHVSGFSWARRAGVAEPPARTEFGCLPAVAPEALADPTAAGPRSDVYSLGVLLFHALTGRYPYEARTRFELLEAYARVRAGEAEVPRAKDIADHVPPHLSVICRRALSLNPKSRPARANAFALALDEWLAVEGSEDEVIEGGPSLDTLARSRDERSQDEDAPASAPPTPRPPPLPRIPGSSTSIVLREFPESLLIPDSLASEFAAFRHECARCGGTSYLLPPMTAETSRCTLCKRGRLSGAPEAKAPAPAPTASAVDLLTGAASSSSGEVVLELPESLRAPAGLERSLSEFKHRCLDCGEPSYLLPPMTPANTRCTACAGTLRPWDEDGASAAEDAGPAAETVTVTRRATGESRQVRRVPPASRLVSMSRFRLECWRCGQANFVLPPNTPETSECVACAASLRERKPSDSDRLVAAVAQVASPSDSQLSLTADGISLEESDHGTGYIQWTTAPKVPTVRLPRRRRLDRKTGRPAAGLTSMTVRLSPRRAPRLVRRPVGAGFLWTLALTAVGALAWHGLPDAAAPLPPPPPQQTAKVAAAASLDGRYRLWLGNKTIDAAPSSPWCVLELSHLGRGALAVDAWRPDSELVCTRAVVLSSGTVELILRRSYDPGESAPPAWFEGDPEEVGWGQVQEVWELRGRLVGAAEGRRITGRGKLKHLRWGRAQSTAVRFGAEPLPENDDEVLEALEAEAAASAGGRLRRRPPRADQAPGGRHRRRPPRAGRPLAPSLIPIPGAPCAQAVHGVRANFNDQRTWRGPPFAL
jgi:serine/threonine-protein kinase